MPDSKYFFAAFPALSFSESLLYSTESFFFFLLCVPFELSQGMIEVYK